MDFFFFFVSVGVVDGWLAEALALPESDWSPVAAVDEVLADWLPVVVVASVESDWLPVVVVLSIVTVERPRASIVGLTVEVEPVIEEFTSVLEPVIELLALEVEPVFAPLVDAVLAADGAALTPLVDAETALSGMQSA